MGGDISVDIATHALDGPGIEFR